MKSNSGPVCRLFARGTLCISILLGGLAVPAGAGGATISAVYSDFFTVNQDASAQAVQDWVNFRASLIPSAYDTVTISGTFDTTGRTLTDPTIVPQIAAALHNGTSGSWTAGGFTWNVGACGSEPAALAANSAGDTFVCSCNENPGYIVRPDIGDSSWGGVNTATCGGPSQTMTVTFSGSVPLPNYAVSQTKGATIVPGTTDTSNHIDDGTTPIALPFDVTFYDQTFTAGTMVNVSSNGNLQFTSNNISDGGGCLPQSSMNNLIAPTWADYYSIGDNADNNNQPNGVFTSISGLAPNRILNIEWRVSRCCSPSNGYFNFEVRLYEGRQHIDFVYGPNVNPNDVGAGDIGLQRDTGSEFVSPACGSPVPPSGVQYTFAEITITPATVNETTGNSFSGPVAYFTNTRSGALAADFTATIDWGDGTTAAGTLTAGVAANTFTVTGTHTYAAAGPFTTSIRVTDSVDTHSDVGTGSAGQCITTPMNLVSWWPGDGNAMDIQGTNGGTLKNGATFGVGEVGQAFQFDGVDDYVLVPDSPSLNYTDFTYDAWIAPDPNSPAGDNYIICKGQAGTYLPLIYMSGPSGSHNWRAIVDGTSLSGPTVTYAYQHIAVSRSGSVGKLYVDGVLQDTETVGTTASAGYDLNFGQIPGFYSSGEFFKGRIDEVEVFNRALTQSEIQSIYNAGSFGNCKTISLYVSNLGLGTIEKFDASGNDLGTFANSGLSEAYDLAFDFTGNLYAANFGSNTVEEFDPAGNDLGIFASSNLNEPIGLAFDASGSLYVLSYNTGTVEKFNSTGGDQGAFAKSLAQDSYRLAFDVSGNLYVTNFTAGRVEKFSPAGTDLGVFATSNLAGPVGLAFDRNGFLHVGNFSNDTIAWFDAAATDLGVFANSGLNHSYGLAFEPAGNSYSANDGDATIEKFDPAGNGSQFANGTSSSLKNPVSIAIRQAAVAATPAPTATPGLSTVPNPSTVTLGTSSVTLNDSGTLSGGNSPTGTVTFTLANSTSTIVDAETVTVNGNGSYTTPTGYTLPSTGTVTGTYQWNASYSGDTNNSTATDNNNSNESVVVSPASPSVTTTARGTVTVGSGVPMTDTAALAGGYHPTGTITFTLKSPSNTTVDTETITVSGNGNYSTPTGFTPTQAGTYMWHATYAGDANNNTATDNGQNESEIANPAPTPTPTPTPTPHHGTANGSGTIFTHNNQASFSFNISDNNKKGTPSGTLTYTDKNGGITLTSTAITAITLDQNQANFSGYGTIANSKPKGKPIPVSFSVTAVDNGTPGAPKDTFAIQISTPYYASGNLTSGNIVVH